MVANKELSRTENLHRLQPVRPESLTLCLNIASSLRTTTSVAEADMTSKCPMHYIPNAGSLWMQSNVRITYSTLEYKETDSVQADLSLMLKFLRENVAKEPIN